MWRRPVRYLVDNQTEQGPSSPETQVAEVRQYPVMGGKYGTCFDISVLKEGQIYRMWLSWRPKQSVALVESKDGIHWSEPPQIVLGPRPETGWEDDINRPRGRETRPMVTTCGTPARPRGRNSWIGYATSPDGVHWKRMSDKPVLSFEKPWEKVAVMCPHVIWDAEHEALPDVVFRRRAI